jgi:SAM-dependent methyltransferase
VLPGRHIDSMNSKVPLLFSNPGYCPICGKDSTFEATREWFRDFYICRNCGTIPRQRALTQVLNTVEPRWRDLSIHESSPSIDFFARECSRYTASYYFEEVPLGSTENGLRCENLEQMTFPEASFDIFLTQDVLEHVFRPDLAVREIARVLKPGGVHVFTVPKHKGLLKSVPRARWKAHREIEHLMPPEYHGNPIGDGRSLVTWDYGADFDDLLAEWSGYLISNYLIRDRRLGIDGEFLDVFVMRKESANVVPWRATKSTGSPTWNIELVGDHRQAWTTQSFEVVSGRDVVIAGWAVDLQSKAPAGGVVVVIDGSPLIAQYGGFRPDVADLLQTPGYERSGYLLTLPQSRLEVGVHVFYVHVLTYDRQRYWEVGPYTLNVR